MCTSFFSIDDVDNDYFLKFLWKFFFHIIEKPDGKEPIMKSNSYKFFELYPVPIWTNQKNFV